MITFVGRLVILDKKLNIFLTVQQDLETLCSSICLLE